MGIPGQHENIGFPPTKDDLNSDPVWSQRFRSFQIFLRATKFDTTKLCFAVLIEREHESVMVSVNLNRTGSDRGPIHWIFHFTKTKEKTNEPQIRIFGQGKSGKCPEIMTFNDFHHIPHEHCHKLGSVWRSYLSHLNVILGRFAGEPWGEGAIGTTFLNGLVLYLGNHEWGYKPHVIGISPIISFTCT